MGEKPILFSAPMVRAIIAGTKTQTRRLVAHKVVSNGFSYDRELGDFLCHNDYLPPSELLMQVRTRREQYDVARCEGWELLCPHGQPGDRLWVREAWAVGRVFDKTRAGEIPTIKGDGLPVWYAADGGAEESWANRGRWRPSIHMPRWASRILLEITDVRVQRLRDISEEDARAEGVDLVVTDRECPPGKVRPLVRLSSPWLDTAKRMPEADEVYRCEFAALWDEINGKRAPWASNPWVWCVSFKRVEESHG